MFNSDIRKILISIDELINISLIVVLELNLIGRENINFLNLVALELHEQEDQFHSL